MGHRNILGQWKYSLFTIQGGSLVAQRVKHLPVMWKTQVLSLEDPLEKEMATHSTILAWRILWTEDPGELQSTGLQRVKLDWMTNIFTSPRTALQSLLLCIHTTETYDALSYVLGKARQMWRSTSRKNMGAGARHVTGWILTTCFTSLGLIFCSSLKKIKQHLMPLSSYKNGKETWDKRWLRSIVFFLKNRNIFFAKY